MRGLHQEMSFESKDWTGDSSRPAGGPIDPLRYNRAYPIGLNRSPFSDKLNFPFSQTMLITFVHPVSSEKESNQHESSQTAERKKRQHVEKTKPSLFKPSRPSPPDKSPSTYDCSGPVLKPRGQNLKWHQLSPDKRGFPSACNRQKNPTINTIHASPFQRIYGFVTWVKT